MHYALHFRCKVFFPKREDIKNFMYEGYLSSNYNWLRFWLACKYLGRLYVLILGFYIAKIFCLNVDMYKVGTYIISD
jgi:hypothetical protein